MVEAISGLYSILNTVNGYAYYGSAVNIDKRWKFHVWKLNNNRHENSWLQHAWNKYGSQCFDFRVIRRVSKCHLLDEEQKLLNRYVGTSNCYNIAQCAHAPMLGRHHSTDVKRRIGKSNRTTKKMHGELNGFSKLTEKQVKRIRCMYPTFSSIKLAQQYKVSKKAVLDIIHRRRWAHI